MRNKCEIMGKYVEVKRAEPRDSRCVRSHVYILYIEAYIYIYMIYICVNIYIDIYIYVYI
jgi:hypothetical protein